MTTFDPNTIQTGSSRLASIQAQKKIDLDNQQCQADMLKLIPAFQQAIVNEMNRYPFAGTLDITDLIPDMPKSCNHKVNSINRHDFVDMGKVPFVKKQWDLFISTQQKNSGLKDYKFYLAARSPFF